MHPRIAGLTIPLSSIRTRRDWGIGQINDLPACAAWAKGQGFRLLQILPPYELAAGETSPYGARTAFGLDPIYAAIDDVADLDAAAIAEALGADGERDLARARDTARTDFALVRPLKERVLRKAFERFRAREWTRGTARAAELRAFVERERAWADDLALYVALRDAHGGLGWSAWPAEERDREPQAMARARERFADRILEHQYVQWTLHGQWERARTAMRGLGVELMGDLPFVVCHESADVWARAGQFQSGMSLGAPPDGFTPDGQDWGLPPYDWTAMDQDDLAWLRARTRQAARLYDRFRLDHVVGYFRMWIRRPGERGRFDPEDEAAQRARGERILRMIAAESGTTEVIAEDLGVIPPWVREKMRELGIPGYRVIPWEKDEQQRFLDPTSFPATSVATWSTHDTPPFTQWWDDFTDDERDQLARMARVDRAAPDVARDRALFTFLYRSGADLVLALAPEVLGEKARINTPATVGDWNWTYRLPMPLDALATDPRIAGRMAWLRETARASGR